MPAVDDIKRILLTVDDELERIQAIHGADDLHGDVRSGALHRLRTLRENLESLPVLDEDDDADPEIESALDDVDNTLEELNLFDSLPTPTLEDLLQQDVPTSTSRPLGTAMLERLERFIQSEIPQREALRAIDDVVDPELAEDADDDALEEAEEMGLDHLLHDWRWAEGSSVIHRFREANSELDSTERATLDVLEMCHLDVYRVDDIDTERATVHLERIHDGAAVHVELGDDLDDVLHTGDALVGRIYVWGDGAQLGACLPIEGASVAFLEEWLEELESEEHPPPCPSSRSGLFKTYGHLLATEILFPEEADDG